MLNFSPLLGIDVPILGKINSLITPFRFYSKSKLAVVELTQINPLGVNSPLIQPARLLGTNSTDRLHHSNQQSEIGWDNWQPIDRPSDRDDFNYKVDRSPFNMEDRSSPASELEHPELDFFTTVLPTEFAQIDPSLNSLDINEIDSEIPTPLKKDRSTTAKIQPQSTEIIEPKSVEPDRKLVDLNQIHQPKSPQVFTNLESPQIPQISPKTLEKSTVLPESSLAQPLPEDSRLANETTIALSLDHLSLNTIDEVISDREDTHQQDFDSFQLRSIQAAQPSVIEQSQNQNSEHIHAWESPDSLTDLLVEISRFETETSTNLNFGLPESSVTDLTQISKSIAPTTANLESPPAVIPDPIIPNLLDTPTIINPVTPPKISPLDPTINTSIIPESTLSPAIPSPFTIQAEIAPIAEFPSNLRSDPIAPNPLESPTFIDSQPPEIASTQSPRLEQREDIPSVVPSAVEPVRELISDTLPLDLADSPITNQPLSTDPATLSASLDEFAIANLDVPIVTSTLRSDLIPTTSQLFADPAQIAATLNQISPDIESTQPLNPATTQLNLAADSSNIDRDSDSVQLQPENLNIPESSNTLLASNPDQIAASITPVKITADLESTQLLNADIFQLARLDATIIDRAPSALEQTSTFTEEPIPENLEDSPIPIVEATNIRSIDSDLTIKSIPSLSLDSPQFNIAKSALDNPSVESTEIIEGEQKKLTKASNEFSSETLLTSPIIDRSSITQKSDSSLQSIIRIEDISTNIADESDDIINPVENQINNTSNTINIDRVITEAPEINQEKLLLRSIDLQDDNVEDNSADITIPAPTVGYATGGYVKDATHIDLQSIASSDTVSAMLTPGEFVINAKDAQKNLDLLTHINRGGEPAVTLPNPEIQPSIIEPVSTLTDISLTQIQRKPNNSLIQPSLQQDISLQQLSSLINTGLDRSQSSQTESSNSSPTYSSPSMVFRKSMSSSQPQYTGTDTPDQWGSIEDLINGSSQHSDTFSFDPTVQEYPNVESRSSPMVSPQYTSPTRGFANGGEVTPSDISTTIEPIIQTIEAPINNSQPQPENNDPAELEILAREIYHRLRQRLEIERERHGSYSGNLAW